MISLRRIVGTIIRGAQSSKPYRALRPLSQFVDVREATAAELARVRRRYSIGFNGAQDEHGVQLVAVLAGVTVGEVVFARTRLRAPITNTPEAWLYRLEVRRWCRHLGIGARLVSAVVERAHREGFTAINLEVNPKNVSAIGLYRAEGFLEVASDDVGIRSSKLLRMSRSETSRTSFPKR